LCPSVVVPRQLLKPYMFRKNGERTRFKLKTNPVLDDLRVFDMYDLATQKTHPLDERLGHWVQEFDRMEQVLTYLKSQFEDFEKVQGICEEMRIR